MHRGELRGIVRAVLEADGSCTVRQLVEQMMERELKSNDARASSADLVSRFGRVLPKMELSGQVVRSTIETGKANIWSLARRKSALQHNEGGVNASPTISLDDALSLIEKLST